MGSITLFVTSGSRQSEDECGLAFQNPFGSELDAFLNDSYDVSDYGNGWWHWCSYPSGD